MKKEINIYITQDSITKAIQQLKKSKKELNDKIDEFVKKLAEKGVEIVKEEISILSAIDSGELLDSIQLEKGNILSNGSEYYVYTMCPYAAYVEFGTGIVGASFPHNEANEIGWEYDVNNHGNNGWRYLTADGKWHWTKGKESRPFMYNTTNRLADIASQVAIEVFRK